MLDSGDFGGQLTPCQAPRQAPRQAACRTTRPLSCCAGLSSAAPRGRASAVSAALLRLGWLLLGWLVAARALEDLAFDLLQRPRGVALVARGDDGGQALGIGGPGHRDPPAANERRAIGAARPNDDVEPAHREKLFGADRGEQPAQVADVFGTGLEERDRGYVRADGAAQALP